jgi:asparagine synthase (glutamine-hydrolysing)
MVGEILSKEHIETRGLFEYEKIQKLINDNDCGRRDSAYTIFSLLCIEIWCQKFIDRIPNTF